MQQQEEHFRRTIKKAKPSILNRKSPANGLAPIHFAVLWPIGLRILVERGADVNIEDNYGRRPVHLAVALGIDESVRCLLNADCGLFTPAEDYSLLQYALQLDESQILLQIIQALRDRHSRLRDMAISHLPRSVSARLELTPGELQEQRAPSIMETLLSWGIDVPPALDLDGKGLYDFVTDYSRRFHITPKAAANQLWSAGFHRFDQPNDNGWTPFLQSCFSQNFEMTDWFASRGARLDSRHADVPLTALHLYAKGMLHSRTVSQDMPAVKQHCIESIQEELGIPYDNCTCICSPTGCTPGKFIVETDSAQIREFIRDLNPPKPLLKRATLNSAMSHYDEMNRPDTMPADEQVYAYINWILKEGYLDIDVSNGCEHDGEPLDGW
ncbi:hypothetical protein J4E89_008035 [Alternaria sp. Ai002NY15]|nr:hypothetical protein J4E89_008035 [Alternaria sp. Ai002NY15]